MYRGDTPFCSEECRRKQIETEKARHRRKKQTPKGAGAGRPRQRRRRERARPRCGGRSHSRAPPINQACAVPRFFSMHAYVL
ncbi:hypothetical protein ZWY2020_041889 [Hordeum vulgare]|nr:hypothetical protein ZWY2020_041889 [Hordeum vulgare]